MIICPSAVDVPGIENVRMYPYKELKYATGDFSPVHKVGEGGYGSVYKVICIFSLLRWLLIQKQIFSLFAHCLVQGRLKDGKNVAIKVLSPESAQGVKEFLTEITVISNIMHENLVQLYGCCIENDNRILVYNYLENNSLAQTLLGDSCLWHIKLIHLQNSAFIF